MIGAVAAIAVLGTVFLAVVAYMEWVGLMTLFGPHGTLRELLDGHAERVSVASLRPAEGSMRGQEQPATKGPAIRT